MTDERAVLQGLRIARAALSDVRDSLVDPDQRDSGSIRAEIREALAGIEILTSILRFFDVENSLEDELEGLYARSCS